MKKEEEKTNHWFNYLHIKWRILLYQLEKENVCENEQDWNDWRFYMNVDEDEIAYINMYAFVVYMERKQRKNALCLHYKL